ncbi:MAG: PH domain-containing protein [Archangiaceae bacterium]|nr:PH domain-containing protein [Archangiaceae bacterium]
MTDDELTKLRAKVHAITRPEKGLLLLYVLMALMTCFLFPIVFIPLLFRYETLRYRFDDEGVFMSFGIIFRREMQLTYARMQDIHLSQNIVERWLNIGTVTIQTAGSGEASHLAIAGVRDSDAIRDYLYARMRGVREHKAVPTAGADALLTEIRDALRDTAAALKGGAR